MTGNLGYCTWDKISKPIEEKRGEEKRKTSNFQCSCGPQRRAFNQAFQPSVNYSRQRRRTRTLSAITLHFSLPSVSNINVIAFIFSDRLRVREASFKPPLSLSLSFCLSVNIWHLKTTHRDRHTQWWPVPKGQFKNECLATCEDKCFSMYLLICEEVGVTGITRLGVWDFNITCGI